MVETLTDRITHFLRETPELHCLCVQNGWIDNDTLKFEIEHWKDEEGTIAVSFEEVIMEGGGCVADRLKRCGKLRLCLKHDGTFNCNVLL